LFQKSRFIVETGKLLISPGYTELVGIWETNRQYFKFSVAMLL